MTCLKKVYLIICLCCAKYLDHVENFTITMDFSFKFVRNKGKDGKNLQQNTF